MSAPLPSPFLSPVFSPFPPSNDQIHHESHSEHHDSPSPHRKRERVKSFVKHLASPFASPSPSPAHLPSETGSPPNPTISLTPELEHTPSLLRKRRSSGSVRSAMKNQNQSPSPHSSPSSTPFPSPDISKLSPNPNRSSSEIDPNGSPTRKRERVRSFVKSIRRTSSQLFKKDKKDSDSRRSTSTISTLVADSLSVSTAATTPGILRRFSHSRHPSVSSSITTAESDISAGYSEVKVRSDEGPFNSPIIEVVTPISPAVDQPVDVTPMSPVNETSNEEDAPPETKPSEAAHDLPPLNDPSLPEAGSHQPAETASENSDPIHFPLPPSPLLPPSLVVGPVDTTQTSVGQEKVGTAAGNDPARRESDVIGSTVTRDTVSHDETHHDTAVAHENVVSHEDAASREDPISHEASREDAVPHKDTTSRDDKDPSSVPSAETSPSSGQVLPPATTDIPSSTPPPHQISRPSSPPPSPSASTSGPGREEEDRQMRDLCIPVLIPPMLFWPISNMRLSYFFTPVLTWWLSKGVLSYPYLYS